MPDLNCRTFRSGKQYTARYSASALQFPFGLKQASHQNHAPPEEQVRAALMTREYPPNVYGGAGVHVEYLSRELARKIEVEVHCWGDQHSDEANLHVCGAQPWDKLAQGEPQKFTTALEAMS